MRRSLRKNELQIQRSINNIIDFVATRVSAFDNTFRFTPVKLTWRD